jgi:hypothetical protein
MKLAERLRWIVNDRLNVLDSVREAADLHSATEEVRRAYGATVSPYVTTDRIKRAVERLAARGSEGLIKGDRYVLAYGLTQGTSVLKGRSVLSDARLAAGALGVWEREGARGALGAGVWRGLFHSYLQAAPSEAVARLQSLLKSSLPGVSRRVRGDPEWLAAVIRHQGLLGANPCASYVDEVVQGGRAQLDDLITFFTPAAPGWLWDEITHALSRHIETLGAQTLEACIPFALQLLRTPHVNATARRDRVLQTLLDQYCAVTNGHPHPELQAFALEAWKSPQLRSSAAWGLVRVATKQMVCGWLAQEDLEDFYRLCQDGRQVDDRRLRYWLRFKRQIGFSQIVLGNALFYSRDSDTRDFIERKKGRVGNLQSSSRNNAILIQIGDWLFAEFSESGNACYPYRMDHRPFELGSATYTTHSLKDVGAVEASKAQTLIHRGDWESEFDRQLGRWGISTPEDAEQSNSRASESSWWVVPDGPEAGRSQEFDRPRQPRGQRPFLPDMLRDIRAAGGRVEDLRPKGGCLWVYLEFSATELDVRLRHLGFKYKGGRGYYKE